MPKSKTISKADLVGIVADETGMKKKDVKELMDVMLDKISENLDKNMKVQLTGFGTFEVRKRKPRTGVKPGTTEKIKIPSSNYPAFKPGKQLRSGVSGLGTRKGRHLEASAPEGDPMTPPPTKKKPKDKK